MFDLLGFDYVFPWLHEP